MEKVQIKCQRSVKISHLSDYVTFKSCQVWPPGSSRHQARKLAGNRCCRRHPRRPRSLFPPLSLKSIDR